MAQPLQELAVLLQSLQSLKAPGVSKSKVDAITKLCTSQSPQQLDRGQIVDVIINAFRTSPPTHKLGVLYCADSVVRQWIAQGGNGNGVERLTQRIPSLMEDLIATAPEEQKIRIVKLLDIWLGSKTFSADMLNSFKQRLSSIPSSSQQGTTNGVATPFFQHSAGTDVAATPSGAPQQLHHPPPATSTPMNGQAYAQPAVATPTNANLPNPTIGTPNTLHQAQFQAPNPAAQALAAMQGLSVNPGGIPQQHQQAAFMQFLQPQTQAPANPIAPPPFPQQQIANLNQAAVQQNAAAPALPALNPTQLQAIQAVVQANPSITAEQLMAILSAMGIHIPAAGAGPPPPAPPPQPTQYIPPGGDPNAYARDRSRSPDYKRRRVTPPLQPRRESPVYGAYEPAAAKGGTNTPRASDGNDSDRRERGRKGRDNYRKRSPPRERLASPSMMHAASNTAQGPAPKPFGHDPSLSNGRIRVLSRTLFVGGVSATANEDQLMDYIARFARVQSCIVNHDKRHAFLKCISHQDAINAKQGVDVRPEAEYRHLFERMNWAVGFGPTQFADYKKGESVLPIDVLTDADRKWMKSAEFGGTGGLEIMTGMVVEEPDIEIGAGPSSKAISRRGGKSGFSGRGGGESHSGGGGGGGRRDRGNRGGGGGGGGYDDQRGGGGGYRQDRQQAPAPPMETHLPEPVNIGPPPPVPQFGALPFQFPQFR